MTKYTAEVRVSQLSESLSDPDDREENPAGDYNIMVDVRPGEDPKTRILDEFHETVAIGCLDDFEITVSHLKPIKKERA